MIYITIVPKQKNNHHFRGTSAKEKRENEEAYSPWNTPARSLFSNSVSISLSLFLGLGFGLAKGQGLMTMVTDNRGSDLIDPLQGYSGLALFPSTFQVLPEASKPYDFDHELQAIHNYLNSMVLSFFFFFNLSFCSFSRVKMYNFTFIFLFYVFFLYLVLRYYCLVTKKIKEVVHKFVRVRSSIFSLKWIY